MFLYAACSLQSFGCCKARDRTDSGSGRGWLFPMRDKIHPERQGCIYRTAFLLRALRKMSNRGNSRQRTLLCEFRWHHIALPEDWNREMTEVLCSKKCPLSPSGTWSFSWQGNQLRGKLSSTSNCWGKCVLWGRARHDLALPVGSDGCGEA